MTLSWKRAAQSAAMVLAVVVALALLPSVLKPPEPPKLGPEVGLLPRADPSGIEWPAEGTAAEVDGGKAQRGDGERVARAPARVKDSALASEGERERRKPERSDSGGKPGHPNTGGKPGHPEPVETSSAPAPAPVVAPAPVPAPTPVPVPAAPPPDPAGEEFGP